MIKTTSYSHWWPWREEPTNTNPHNQQPLDEVPKVHLFYLHNEYISFTKIKIKEEKGSNMKDESLLGSRGWSYLLHKTCIIKGGKHMEEYAYTYLYYIMCTPLICLHFGRCEWNIITALMLIMWALAHHGQSQFTIWGIIKSVNFLHLKWLWQGKQYLGFWLQVHALYKGGCKMILNVSFEFICFFILCEST